MRYIKLIAPNNTFYLYLQSENEILKVNNINNKLEDSLQMTKQEIFNL